MRTLVFAVLWIGTVVAAYVLGGMGEGAPGSPEDLAPPTERVPAAALRGHDGGALREASSASPPPVSTVPGTTSAAGRAPTPAADEDPPTFSLEGVTDPDVAFDRLMQHVTALLARGAAGHMELLAFLDDHIVQSKSLQTLFGNEQEAARFIYPMVKFLVERDAEVLDVTETVFRTMAKEPQAFAEFDDDTLEVFTEGVAFLLPGAVGGARLDRFREYAGQILETPESEQPKAVSKNRRRIQRVLGYWAPRLEPDQAVARLQSGEATTQEVLSLLRTLPAEQRAALDLGVLLAPVVASGDYGGIRVLGQVGVESRDLALLDRAAIEGLVGRRLNEWTLHQYLDATGRGTWPAGQPLVEVALAEGDPARSTAALALRRLGPPKEYVAWVLENYDLPEQTQKSLQAAFGLNR